MKIAVIRYNSGNIQSVLYALQRIGADAVATDDPEEIRSAGKVIFPGVGEASSAMHYLREKKLDLLIRDLKQPVLGVCLGMQLLCAHSEEGNTDALGIFPQAVRRFQPEQPGQKVPQMGWNAVHDLKGPLFRNVAENSFVYYVHGFYAEAGAYTIATTDYILPYSGAIQKDNFFGCQFHPEKSGTVGETIIRNFIEL